MKRAWSMPSPWTFSIPPISAWMTTFLTGKKKVVDPFAGRSTLATHRNDLGHGGMDAVEWLQSLRDAGDMFDAALLDPPYSPRQMAEVYRSVGRSGPCISQNAALYSVCGSLIADLVRDDGVCLKFGWNSNAPSKDRWELLDMLTVAHGSAHNDTICTAWRRKPREIGMFATTATNSGDAAGVK